MSGSLVIVGTGIGAARMTLEARAAVAAAEEVLYLVPDAVSEELVRGLNAAARSLMGCYVAGEPRVEAYARMLDAMLGPARAGRRVCAAFYGHPGVFVWPTHEAVRRARAEGIDAWMLPGISAEDCLFADVGLDPADTGCQSYEATRFLRLRPAVETRAALVLWQVGVVGEHTHAPGAAPGHLELLLRRLLELYPPEHEVVLYEASSYPGVAPRVDRVRLADLASADVRPLATLLVPGRPAR